MEKDTEANQEGKNCEKKIDDFFSENKRYTSFLEDNKIDVEGYIKDMKSYERSGLRCIRVNPVCASQEDRNSLEAMGFKPHPIFEDLYLISKDFKISSLELYKKGLIYGIEASSSIVVKCLDPNPGDIILDVCCSPGAKLLQIGDEMLSKMIDFGDIFENGDEPNKAKLANLKRKLENKIIGNDISEHRLNITKNLVEKYGYSGVIKLTLNDAVKLKKSEVVLSGDIDKILCDVECSHDGSFKHILKFVEEGSKAESKKGKAWMSYQERKEAVMSVKGISNKERKRRLRQIEDKMENDERKKRTGEYFSEYKSSKLHWLIFFRDVLGLEEV